MSHKSEKRYNLWKRSDSYQRMDSRSIIESVANHMEFSLCKNPYTAEDRDFYKSAALSVRDRLVELLNDTQQKYYDQDCKRVYYLSLEYLIGRSLKLNLINLGIYDSCKQALAEIGYDIEDIEEMEHDAGLGNGGLGRLAACFMDSMATLQFPGFGYGIRYEYGIFEQKFEQGKQVEYPDNWLLGGFPWEIPRWDILYPIKFYGNVVQKESGPEHGKKPHSWKNADKVLAMAYDIPVSGYDCRTVNNLRLWSARPSKGFDFDSFNNGDYMRVIKSKQESETISKILYPNDKGFSGKELRLKQQYFFVSASLQDIIRRYKKNHETFDAFPDKVALQLNDTHPCIAIPELMRLLVDEHEIAWDKAWDITVRTFSYTNHTVLPEALEKWPLDMLRNLLPRHLEIIFEINQQFLNMVKDIYPDDHELLSRVSLIDEGCSKQLRMPHLAIVGSHVVNGVAAMHTELLKNNVFKDFYKLYPDRFQNKTNGITPRLWLCSANPELSSLITQHIGQRWIKRLDDLKALGPLADNPEFRKEWIYVKQAKKAKLAAWIQKNTGIHINPESMFDVHIKRIHEYKRQLLNIVHCICVYNRIKQNPENYFVPRTVIFGGKAAPGYYMAKLIINLINDVANVVNHDHVVGDRLKIVFIENYGVSVAEKIIPATDLSQHISTAGTEASGTSNMKFSLNGSLIIGTLDGANIEIMEQVGKENIFTFGLNAGQVSEQRAHGYNPGEYYHADKELSNALEMINNGYFNHQHPHLYNDIYNSLLYEDAYMLLADFAGYRKCQEKVNKAWGNQKNWTKMSILNTANSGKFSSDRTIQEYAEHIWKIESVPIETSVYKRSL
jgi:glycogen phosphorylase